MKIILAITGASGSIYGIRLLEELKNHKIETHLIISKWAKKVIQYETSYQINNITNLASAVYKEDELNSCLSSGTFITDGMIVAPCSMKTVSAIAHGYANNLIVRASNVCIKEHRKLIILPRETPLSAISLENLLSLAKQNVFILPPMPAFYLKINNISQMVNYTVGKVLDCFDIKHNLFVRWGDDIHQEK